jgi:hypothetical protein
MAAKLLKINSHVSVMQILVFRDEKASSFNVCYIVKLKGKVVSNAGKATPSLALGIKLRNNLDWVESGRNYIR